jgi:hypothetical protein
VAPGLTGSFPAPTGEHQRVKDELFAVEEAAAAKIHSTWSFIFELYFENSAYC